MHSRLNPALANYFDGLVLNQQFEQQSQQLVESIAIAASQQQLVLVTAESCTGGWIAQQLSARAGSSQWFDSGMVTYSNEAKSSILGVDPALLESGGPGAVSEETVLAMTAGALAAADGRADLAVAVSGVAGPDGGSELKPVGTVWIAWQDSSIHQAHCYQFAGDREAVRQATVLAALAGFVQLLQTSD